MIYLVKMQRCFNNHQYITGIYADEDIAHFMGEYHQKFVRGGYKYYYTIETHDYFDSRCFIVSWENDDESLKYRLYRDEEHAMENTRPEDSSKYRYKAMWYETNDYNITEDELMEAADCWHFFKGKQLLGLSKLYERYKENKRKEFIGEVRNENRNTGTTT